MLVAGCGGDSAVSTTLATTTRATPPYFPLPVQHRATIVVSESGVAGGPKQVSVAKGRILVLIVRSALADEIHVHGYDRTADVAAGGTARLRFRCTLVGRFEIELESRGLPIGELKVRP